MALYAHDALGRTLGFGKVPPCLKNSKYVCKSMLETAGYSGIEDKVDTGSRKEKHGKTEKYMNKR